MSSQVPKDFDSLSSQVPSNSDIPFHVLPLLPLYYTQHIRIDNSAGTDTLLSGILEAPCSPMVPQVPSKIVDAPISQSIHTRNSTRLPYFAYSCYSLSFTSFLTSIHYLSELSSYQEEILDSLWQQAMC